LDVPYAMTAPSSSSAVLTLSNPDSTIKYFGFSLRETGAGAISINIREGSATGPIIDAIRLSANESAREWYGPQGLVCNSNVLYYEVVGGGTAPVGSVRVG